jgi:hypothetical protein
VLLETLRLVGDRVRVAVVLPAAWLTATVRVTVPRTTVIVAVRAVRIRDLLERHLGRPLSVCPDCGAKDSLIRILLPHNARAPPADFVYMAIK